VLSFISWQLPAQPVITVPPTNQIVLANSTNTFFSVGVSGTGPFSYQWQLNGTNLPNGIITTVKTTNVSMSGPCGMAVDAAGNIFIADSGNHRVRKVDTNGMTTTIAGTNAPGENQYGYSGDGGPASNARLNDPNGLALDNHGNLFIVDCFNQRIREINTNGIIFTVAGNGTNGYAGDGGPATNAQFQIGGNQPCGIAFDALGNLFVPDWLNARVRKIDTNGIITTVAGNGFSGDLGDGGPATNASIKGPMVVAADASGQFFIVESAGLRVRKVDTNGIITTVAGGGSGLVDGGLATNAHIEPFGLCVDTNGSLFIGDITANRRGVRKVDTNGIITTVAGKGGIGSSGDGGMATNATMSCPYAIAFDPLGNMLILDQLISVVRKVWFAGLPSYALNKLSPNLAGNYQVIVTSSSGSATSSVATLDINYPSFTQASVSTNTGIFSLAWPGFQPSTFQVEYTTNLAAPGWSNLGGTTSYAASTNGTATKSDPTWLNDTQRFYRVRWVQ